MTKLVMDWMVSEMVSGFMRERISKQWLQVDDLLLKKDGWDQEGG